MDVNNPHFLHNLTELAKLMQLDDGQQLDAAADNGQSRTNGQHFRTEQSKKMCNFCKRNGETSTVFLSHNLREEGKVTCPILWKHKCELCGATGDKAHTRSYCFDAAAQRSLQANSDDRHIYHNSVVLKKGRNSSGVPQTKSLPRDRKF